MVAELPLSHWTDRVASGPRHRVKWDAHIAQCPDLFRAGYDGHSYGRDGDREDHDGGGGQKSEVCALDIV